MNPRVGYVLETFPKRTENFIGREIACVRRRWPDLRVYCMRAAPDAWACIDRADELRRAPVTVIRPDSLGAVNDLIRSAFVEPLAHLGLAGRSLRMSGGSLRRAARVFFAAVRLSRAAAEDGVELLHAHFASEPALVASLAATRLGIPYTISAHARDIWCETAPRAVIEGAERCLVCTAQGRDALAARFPDAPVHLVRHGVSPGDPDRIEQLRFALDRETSPVRILAAGRFVAKKGFDFLIEACQILIDSGLAVDCRIFGDGALRRSLERRIDALGLRQTVQLEPFAPHSSLRQEMQRAHILAAPSRVDPEDGDRDGVPNVVLEAISLGAIVVASALPSLEEVVRDSRTGFLAAPEDASALARAIKRALDARAEWPSIRKNAREFLEREFSEERNIQCLLRHLEEACASPRARSSGGGVETWSDHSLDERR